MQQHRGDTGLNVISYEVITKATLDFNQAMKYMSERLTNATSDDEDLSSFVDRWWSNLSKVYRATRLSLEAEGGPEVSLFYLQTSVLDAVWSSCCKYQRNSTLGKALPSVALTRVELP